MGSIVGQNRVITKDVISYTCCCYVKYATFKVRDGEMPLPKTYETNQNGSLKPPDKNCAVYNSWDVIALGHAKSSGNLPQKY